MPRSLCSLLLLAAFGVLSVVTAGADPALKGRTYHFGVHDARTTIVFTSEADLETIHGVTHKAAGSVTIDASGSVAKADLSVPVASLRTGIDLRDEHLRSEQWLDVKKYPDIQLEIEEAKEDVDGRTWTWKGTLRIKGKSRPLAGVARINVIPDELGKQLGAGSWLRVRTGFDVRLADFGIAIPDHVGPKVSAVWPVKVDLYASTVLPAK